MAALIESGYDFAVNEIPTKETLLRQARFLKVTNIDIDSIDVADLTGVLSGTTSGTTGANMPSQGWLWADPAGSLWVETENGPVKMKRSSGGWESRRYPFNPGESETAGPWVPGWPYFPESDSGQAAQSENTTKFIAEFQDSTGGGLRNHFVSPTTNDSGTTFPRIVGRGATLFHPRGQSLSETHVMIAYPSVLRIFSTSNGWVTLYNSGNSSVVSGSTTRSFYASGLAPDAGTSLVLSGSDLRMQTAFWGWKFDGELWKEGLTI